MCWRKDLDSMQKRMLAAMNNKIPDLCHDVTFLVGNDEVEISCHKIFLVIASPVFEAMFSQRHNSQETPTSELPGECKAGNKVIVISDVHPDGLKNIINYAYTGILNVDVQDATATMYAAHKYDIPELYKHCSQVLHSKLSVENAVAIYQAAKLLNDENLEKNAWEFILTNAVALLVSDQFLEFTGENLRKFLSMDSMPNLKSEVDIFKALMRWGSIQSIQCDQESLNSSEEENMRSVLEPYLSLIRFPAMEVDDFNEVVVESRVLSWKECVDLYKYFTSNSGKRGSIGATLKYSSESRIGSKGNFVFCSAAINEKLETSPKSSSYGCFTITGDADSIKLKSVGVVLPSKSTQFGDQCVSVGLYDYSINKWTHAATSTVSKPLEICYIEFGPPVILKMNVKYQLRVNYRHTDWVEESKQVEVVKYSKELMNQSTFTWRTVNNHLLKLDFNPPSYTIWALQFE